MQGDGHCGEVRYRLDRDPIFVNACHCRDCQKQTGTAFALNAIIEASAVAIDRGAPVRDAQECWRCPTCEVLLWATHRLFGDGVLFLRVGTLDHAEDVSPDAHFFTRSRHPWIALPADTPAFEMLPGPGGTLFGTEARERIAAAQTGG